MEKKYKTLKLAMYPSKRQEQAIGMFLDHVRYVGKVCMYYLKHYRMERGKVCSKNELYGLCNGLRKHNPWLRESYAQCLYDAAGRARQSFKKQMDNHRSPEDVDVCGYPSDKDTESFLYPSDKGFKVYYKGKKRVVKMGKVPGEIKVRNRTEVEGVPKTLRVIRWNMGTHYEYECVVSYLMPEGYREGRTEAEVEESEDVGLDAGLEHAAYLSDGKVYDIPEEIRESEKRLRKLRSARDRAQGTPWAAKAQSKYAHALRRVRNLKTEFRNTVVHEVLRDHRDVYIEDLDLARMQKKANSKGMRRSYARTALGRLLTALCSKAELTFNRVVKVDPRDTSKLCSRCGAFVDKDLSVRVHECPYCGFTADRDYNAAVNILRRGLSAGSA